MAFNIPQNTGFPSSASTAPTFNFGSSTTTAAKGFGQPTLGFGAPTSTAFGNSNTGGFGVATSTGFGTAPAAGGFGTAQPANTFGAPAANAFGGGTTAFGAPAASTGFGGFGSTLGTSNTSGGSTLFGGAPATGNMFGATQPATSTFQGFGGTSTFGQPSSTGGLFGGTGLQTSTANTGFGANFSFNAKPATGQTAFGSFGAGTSNLFGQGQQQMNQFSLGGQAQLQQQQQQQIESADCITACIFGDDRDNTMSNWNRLQARWGFGKGHTTSSNTIPYSPQNPFCCFKAVGYNLLPVSKDEDGMVAITVTPKDGKAPDQEQLRNSLNQTLFAGRPYMVQMHGQRAAMGTSYQYTISVIEKSNTGQQRRLTATELATNLTNVRQQLSTLGVENLVPVVAPSQDLIKEYLANPPAGLDRKLWEQALKDNPDPERLIPVPMIGFSDLKVRMNTQEMECSKHLSFLHQTEQKVADLRRSMAETEVKLTQRRQALQAVQQRLLNLLVKLQVARRAGATLLPMEEDLRTRLENIKDQLSRPSHCKAKLGEIVAQTRLQKCGGSVSMTGNYSMDPEALQDFHKFLKMEQEGISQLIDVVSSDQNCLRLMAQTVEELNAAKSASKTSINTRYAINKLD